jgi:hypothetical protein
LLILDKEIGANARTSHRAWNVFELQILICVYLYVCCCSFLQDRFSLEEQLSGEARCIYSYLLAAEVPNLLQATKVADPAVLLKRCALAHVFKRALDTGDLPADWKTPDVTPIFKVGGKQDVEKYRLTSITSLVGKILERFARVKSSEFREANEEIPPQQHIF